MNDLPYFIIHGDLPQNCTEETEVELEYIDSSNSDNNFKISTTCKLVKNQATDHDHIVLTDEMMDRLFTISHLRKDRICMKEEFTRFNEMEIDECTDTII